MRVDMGRDVKRRQEMVGEQGVIDERPCKQRGFRVRKLSPGSEGEMVVGYGAVMIGVGIGSHRSRGFWYL